MTSTAKPRCVVVTPQPKVNHDVTPDRVVTSIFTSLLSSELKFPTDSVNAVHHTTNRLFKVDRIDL